MTRIGWIVPLIVLAACGGGGEATQDAGHALSSAEARAALPGREAVRVASPARQTAAASTRGAASRSTEGEGGWDSSMDASSAFAATVDGIVGSVIDMIERITAAAPAECEGQVCTWRPAPGPQDTLLAAVTVTRRLDPLRYDWVVEAGPIGAGPPPAAVARGSFTPGSGDGEGSGSFALDLAALSGMGAAPDPAYAAASVEVDYGDVAGRRSLECRFLAVPGILSADGTASLTSRYVESDTGGDFQVAARESISGSEVKLRARWLASGAGRSDLEAAEAGTTLRLSECWSDALDTIYLSLLLPPMTALDQGAESDCAFPAVPVEVMPPEAPSR